MNDVCSQPGESPDADVEERGIEAGAQQEGLNRFWRRLTMWREALYGEPQEHHGISGWSFAHGSHVPSRGSGQRTLIHQAERVEVTKRFAFFFGDVERQEGPESDARVASCYGLTPGEVNDVFKNLVDRDPFVQQRRGDADGT
ncbi:MAG TPA: hypothetical protein VF715_17435 [Thermoleophilaceae bacterium]